jgi:hypothetical protein
VKIFIAALGALSFAALAAAAPRPEVLLPTHELSIPAGFHPWDVAISGDWIAIGGAADADGNPDTYIASERVYLYRRAADGTWSAGTLLFEELSDQYAATVEMNDRILVVGSGSRTRIYEKTAGGWLERTLDASGANLVFPAVAIDGTRVLLGYAGCGANAIVFERTSAAHWAQSGELRGTQKPCDDTAVGNLHIALSGDTAILWDNLTEPPARARVFVRNPSGAWSQSDVLEPTPDEADHEFGNSLALRGSLALVSGENRGTHVYRRAGSDWSHTGYIAALDGSQLSNGIHIGDRYVVYSSASSAVSTNVLRVFRECSDQGFEEVAQLTTPDRTQLLSEFDLSGSTVVAATWTKVFFYQLPESPGARRALQYDFEAGSTAADWRVAPGGSFSIVQSGPSRVYRQVSTAGDAGAIHSEDLTTQAIQADITPTAFNGTDRWFGLVTRYIDENNYYYVTLRNRGSGWVSLRRKLNGVVTELAATPVGVQLNQPLRVRLSSTVDRHAVWIGDFEFLAAVDDSLSHGRVGIRTYRAAADFDNVLVSAAPSGYYLARAFANEASTRPFDVVDGQWAHGYDQFEDGYYGQLSLSGDARSIAWPVADDQIVATWMNVLGFDAGGGDPWVGLIARYQDPANYYYVSLRRSNQISLRRLHDGQITILKSAPLPVQVGDGYDLKLEAVGDRLRVYVNRRFVFEATDSTFASGKAGLVTYRARARFNGFSAYQP